jgi:hypothetical protein
METYLKRNHIWQTWQCNAKPKAELHINKCKKLLQNNLCLKFKSFKDGIKCCILFHAQSRCEKMINCFKYELCKISMLIDNKILLALNLQNHKETRL